MSKRKAKPEDHGPQCGSCRFWKEETQSSDEIRWGVCRQRPPVGVMLVNPDTGEQHVDAVWPPMHLDDWCGKFEGSQ